VERLISTLHLVPHKGSQTNLLLAPPPVPVDLDSTADAMTPALAVRHIVEQAAIDVLQRFAGLSGPLHS